MYVVRLNIMVYLCGN